MAGDTQTEMRDHSPAPRGETGPTSVRPADDVKGIAFFDLDGTLVVGNTQFLLVRFLRAEKIVSAAFVLGSALWFLGYKAGIFKLTETARAKAASMLRGLSVARVEGLMARFIDQELIPRLHQGAVAALQAHQEAGDRVVLVSAALEPVVRSLCGRLGVTEFASAPCEVGGDVYSGRLSGASPYGGLKAEIAAQFMRRWDSDPADCWAYADHSTDLALLQSVGHPVVVNPKPGLEKAARQAGWPILP